MLIATVVPPSSTHKKFRVAAINTDFLGFKLWLYITGAMALAVSFIPFTNSNERTIMRQRISKRVSIRA